MLKMLDRLISAIDSLQIKSDDYLEARYHTRDTTSIQIENGVVKNVSSGITEGLSLRALINGSWGSMTLEGFTPAEIKQGFLKCIELAKNSHSFKKRFISLAEIPINEDIVKPSIRIPTNEISITDKIDVCLEAEKSLRTHNEFMVQASADYFDTVDQKFILTSEGTKLELHDQKTTLLLSGVAKKNGILSPAASRMAGTKGFEIFEKDSSHILSEEVGSRAVRLTEASFAPSGYYTVILGPQLTRLLAHEAFGHTNEADLVTGGSVLQGKINKKICNDKISILDDAIYPGSFGWLPGYDDEGTPAQKTVMVDKGILITHLHNRESAAEYSTIPTGNARAFMHNNDPIIRMTNSVILGGDSSLEEMIAETANGFLLEGRRMGQADYSGEFMFGVQQGREILKGELTDKYYRAVTISGIALDVLSKTRLLSKQIERGFAGFCGKGQTAFTGGGGPFMLTELNVGGKN